MWSLAILYESLVSLSGPSLQWPQTTNTDGLCLWSVTISHPYRAFFCHKQIWSVTIKKSDHRPNPSVIIFDSHRHKPSVSVICGLLKKGRYGRTEDIHTPHIVYPPTMAHPAALGHLSLITWPIDTKFEETKADETFNSLVKYGSQQQFNRYYQNSPTTVVYGLVLSVSKWWWLSNPYNFVNICRTGTILT